jgi:hypothetical protein
VIKAALGIWWYLAEARRQLTDVTDAQPAGRAARSQPFAGIAVGEPALEESR